MKNTKQPTWKKGLFTAVLAVTLVLTMLPTLGRSAEALTSPDNDSWLRMVAFNHGGNEADQTYSRSQALAVVDRFDVMVALRWTFEDHIDAMKAKDPDFTALAYMNGVFSKPTDAKDMPNAWFLRDANGNKVRSVVWGNYYMDPNNSGWRNWVSQRCADWTDLSGYDGCYMDDMGIGNIISDNLSAHPVDPRTGKLMEYGDWIGYVTGLVDKVERENPGILVSANGINHGFRYFQDGVTSRRILMQMDAGHSEGFMRGEKTGINDFRSVERWQADIDMLVNAGNAGKTILAETKIWIGASNSQIKQWRGYTYASFLLGTNGRSYLYFNPENAGKAPAEHPWDSVPIGRAQGSYSKSGDIFKRQYSNGLVVVNPTDSSATISLGGYYETLDGRTVNKLTMGAHSGDILLSTDNPTTTTTTPPPTTTIAPPPPPSTTTTTTPNYNGVLCKGEKPTIAGSSKADVIVGTAGRDVIVGLGGNDTIRGGGGADLICGGPGNDTIHGEDGADAIYGDDGDDILFGGNGDDKVRGVAGNDLLSGGPGVDKVDGGGGDDICGGGGQGQDAVTCESVVDEPDNPSSASCNGLPATIVGTSGNDWIVGTNGRDVIVGLGGNDVVNGKGGNDVICGGPGADVLMGKGGNDDLRGGDGADVIYGDQGYDVLHGDHGDDVLRGGTNADRVFGGVGTSDRCTGGGQSTDLVYCEKPLII